MKRVNLPFVSDWRLNRYSFLRRKVTCKRHLKEEKSYRRTGLHSLGRKIERLVLPRITRPLFHLPSRWCSHGNNSVVFEEGIGVVDLAGCCKVA